MFRFDQKDVMEFLIYKGSNYDLDEITLASGENVLISGFGKLCVKHKAERKGRNPATGDDMMLPPRKVVTFKCSGKLRKKVNGA